MIELNLYLSINSVMEAIGKLGKISKYGHYVLFIHGDNVSAGVSIKRELVDAGIEMKVVVDNGLQSRNWRLLMIDTKQVAFSITDYDKELPF